MVYPVILLLKISRPRFWMYVTGPFIVGYLLGINTPQQFLNVQFVIYLLYFSFPFNFFLYGINDLYDRETDKFNDKKKSHEHLLQVHEQKLLTYGLGLFGTVSILLLLFFQSTLLERALFVLLLFLSWSYSAPPFRWKSKPFLDSASNILYVLPGLFAYVLTTQTLPSLLIIFGLGCWTAAMHLFSAIPDIQADTKAHLATTAVTFGRKKSLIFCIVLWLISSLIIISTTNQFIALLSLAYPLIPLAILLNKKLDENTIYWYFPYINNFFGMITFWSIILIKFYV